MTLQTLLTGWDFMRLFRLSIGLFIGFQAIQTHDSISGMFAALFLFQAITNTGCCGANGCAVPNAKDDQHKIEDIEFEEIKTK
jgi:hypothetical protein